MLNSTHPLASRLREVFIDGTWIANTNYKDLLSSIDWQQATYQVSDFNTIATLTFHIDYYVDGLVRALETGNLDISDRFSFDAPIINSQIEWQQRVSNLLAHAERFIELVAAMDDKQLNGPFINANYGTMRRNIDGMIEHAYYHLGQISLIRKTAQASLII